MRIQKTDWGHIEWMENEAGGIFIQGLNVGLVVLETGANHPPHKHYDEQVNYVVQGQAVAYIDGKEITMKPGNFYHWPMGVVHEAHEDALRPQYLPQNPKILCLVWSDRQHTGSHPQAPNVYMRSDNRTLLTPFVSLG